MRVPRASGYYDDYCSSRHIITAIMHIPMCIYIYIIILCTDVICVRKHQLLTTSTARVERACLIAVYYNDKVKINKINFAVTILI